MKRHGGLWPQVIGFPNLLRAAEQAMRGKKRRPNVARFQFRLERELAVLEQELREKTYRPGEYRTFRIFEPKVRLISAAPFRDRVVHHALCNVLEPIFERCFISDSYACRQGRGTHAAVDRLTEFSRRNRFVLKCDIAKYFPSIDHELLKQNLRRKVKDRDALWLIDTIIDNSNAQDPIRVFFPGDDLFTAGERRRGLPIGNQTSQFFSNVFLDSFDHFVKERLRAKYYVRYVDDFVILADDTAWLDEVRREVRRYLAGMRLLLHPKKSVISRTVDGTPFLGYRVFPTHRLLPRKSVVRFRRRLRALQKGFAQGDVTTEEIRQSLASWTGHAGHADTWRLRKELISTTLFQRRSDPPLGK